MPSREVILNVLELLETMDEGLAYVKENLEASMPERTIPVTINIIDAFLAVEQTMVIILHELKDNKISEKTKKLKAGLDLMVEEYEKKSEQNLYETMEHSLEPVFNEWKEEIEVNLNPIIES